MKRLLFSILHIGLLLQTAFGSSSSRVLVTEVLYERITSEYIDDESFPFYFHHQEFVDDILRNIETYLVTSLHTDRVEFLVPGGVEYIESTFPRLLKTRKYALENASIGTIYAGVKTMLRQGSVVNGIASFTFITQVVAYDASGKKIFHRKVKSPFTPVQGEYISGYCEISENDFYAFYFGGLEAAFEGQVRKLPRISITRPASKYYDDFLVQTRRYYMIAGKKTYRYGNTADNTRDVLYFSGKFGNEIDRGFNIGNWFNRNKVKEAYSVKNTLNNENYQVKLKGGDDQYFDFLSVSSDIQIQFQLERDSAIGRFEYDMNNMLTGSFRNTDYHINRNPDHRCAEIYAGDALIALISDLHDRKLIFLHNAVSDEKLGDIFNLVMTFDLASEMKMRIEAMKDAENGA
jgi:hypothetical protein